MDLKTLLSQSLKLSADQRTEDEIACGNLKIEIDEFNRVYGKNRDNSGIEQQKTNVIPSFYSKIPKESDILAKKLREEARSLFLKNKSDEQLEHFELNELWKLLDDTQSSSTNQEEQLINYLDFLKVGKLAGEKCRSYFTASVFAKLQQGDPQGRISIMALFNYVMRKTWLRQTRISLSMYDLSGNGYLTESDLENYINDLIPTLPQLSSLEPTFHSFYICTAARKFFFFLDPLRTGRIRIQDILTCSFLDALLELRDDDVPKDVQKNNWFSGASALKVYGQYLNLDRDHNGMLSKEELAGYGTGTLTHAFLDRVFQECLTYHRQMDYKTYLDLVLALENRLEPQSLAYLFRILDVNNQGYLDTFSLNYFYRAIQEQMSAHGQEQISFEDVRNEIFDMVKPQDATKITLKDILNCGQGGVMVSILIDLNGFWTHENREAIVAEGSDDSVESLT